MTEKTHHRVDLAKEQLDVALELFLSSRSMVSALTLASAAEEILGKALQHCGSKSSLQMSHETIVIPMTHLRKKRYTIEQFSCEQNAARNAAKHMGRSSETTLTADLEDAAMQMIVRAYDNYCRLGFDRTQRMDDFEQWFQKNIA